MWTLDSRWFDVAAISALRVGMTVLFGRFEQRKPLWKRLAKFAALLVLMLLLIDTAGRAWGYAAFGLMLMTGGAFHFAVLSKLGINGWTGEPREKLEALLRESEVHGDTRTLLRLARGLLPPQ